MKVLGNANWTRVPAPFAVAAILSGVVMSYAAKAQDEREFENFVTILRRDIVLLRARMDFSWISSHCLCNRCGSSASASSLAGETATGYLEHNHFRDR